MTINKMIDVLMTIKNKVGGDKEIPVMIMGYGENDYIEPSFGVVANLEDQDGKEFSCALIGSMGGEELTKKEVPHYTWNPHEDEV